MAHRNPSIINGISHGDADELINAKWFMYESWKPVMVEFRCFRE